MMLAAAKAFSASSVAITDIRPGNLPVAQILGAKYALDQSKAVSTAENVEAIRAVFPEGPDIVIDCVGFSSTITVSCKRCTTGCYRMLQDVAGCYRMLQDVAGCCRMLQDVTGCYRTGIAHQALALFRLGV